MGTIMGLFAFGMLLLVLWDHRQKLSKMLPKRKPKAVVEADPFADYKRHTAKQRELRAEDHADWEAQAREILQANCGHVYHHQKWFQCINCGQEEPWKYAGNCSCRYETVTTISGLAEFVLTRRSPSCQAHGKDYRYWPLSERKQGPYGSSNVTNNTKDLQGQLKVRRVRYEEFTVSPSKGTN